MQPSCRRSAMTGAGQVSPGAGPSAAKKMLFDASRNSSVCTLPITVHVVGVSSAPGPPAASAGVGDVVRRAGIDDAVGEGDLGIARHDCSGPVMQRSSVTFANGCSTIRLGAPGAAALPSGLSVRPGTSVQSRSTSSRGSLSAAAARRSAPPEITSPSSTSRPRAPICERDVAARGDQRPRRIARRDHHLECRARRPPPRRRP